MLKRVFIYRDPFSIKPWWNRSPQEITVQSFVQGRPANCAVTCWEGKVLAGIAVEVVASVAEVGPATVVRAVDGPEMIAAAERIARRLNLSGFFGLDFMIDEYPVYSSKPSSTRKRSRYGYSVSGAVATSADQGGSLGH
jgi:hypothetical protein